MDVIALITNSGTSPVSAPEIARVTGVSVWTVTDGGGGIEEISLPSARGEI
jgi:hypothetical protein